MAGILARVFVLGGDLEHFLHKLLGDDHAIERSVNFTSSFVVAGNLLGNAPRIGISSWLSADARQYPLRRSEVWNSVEKDMKLHEAPRGGHFTPSLSKDEPPAELQDPGRLKHTDIATVSLIREALWEQAGWSGTAFFLHSDRSVPPVFALLFSNPEAAAQIFSHWKTQLGGCDERELLRVSIVRGISRKNPHSYRVVIGMNPSASLTQEGPKLLIMLSRLKTMDPSSSANLDNFLIRYKAFGEYLLGYSIYRDGQIIGAPVSEIIIAKHELHVRPAWEIGPHDIDCVGIQPDDDPLIPAGLKEAPVLQLLKQKRRQE